MYRKPVPKIIAILMTALLFLMFLLASCKSKQQVITEYKYSDSLEVKEVAAVRSTAKATSSTFSLEQMLSSMSLNIDSIVITMPSELSSMEYGENVSVGTAFTPGTPHDHLPYVGMVEGCAYGDTASATGVPVATHSAPLKTATIPSLPTERISPNNARHINVPYHSQQGKIVISGIRLNQQSAQSKADITASSDTLSEVHTDYVEQTAVSSQSAKAVEGKPRSKNVWQYVIVLTGLALAVGYLMKKFHFFSIVTKVIKKIFS